MAEDATESTGQIESGAGYTVLARKYRPQDFDGLIGQEALVRILSNAFERDRVPHAMILTGVRGVGKTSTARIVAKGLNCSASDKPTVKPCGVCDNCVAIAESRHVDVMEMDAASRTGIDDIREIIESVRYRANQARYKVYIIDETHMLSKSAFNGLLKTLEEPPPHVKFILATTDIHKVPVTVLSRCMRFDLRRVEAERLTGHLKGICDTEGVAIDEEALALLARASEGSVRDSLSLLDQAIAHGAGQVEGQTVRDMLGLAERARIFELFEKVMVGDAGGALAALQGLYMDGADPQAVLRELAEVCHLTTVVKISPERADDASLAPAERDLSKMLSEKLPMRALARAWQMMLKSIEEAARAPSAMAAAEMAIIRMTHVADLPSPDELIRKLRNEEGAGAPAGGNGGGNGGGRAPQGNGGNGNGGASASAPQAQLRTVVSNVAPAPMRETAQAPEQAAQQAPAAEAAPDPAARTLTEAALAVDSFEAFYQLIRRERDAKLLIDVERFVRPGPLKPGSFEFTPAKGAPQNLAGTLAERLQRWTGSRWMVSLSDRHETDTVEETRQKAKDDLYAMAAAHPLIKSALESFPGAQLSAVRDASAEIEAAAEAPPDPEAEDDLLDDDFYDTAGLMPAHYFDDED